MIENLSVITELPSVAQFPPELIWSTLSLTFLSFSYKVRKRMLERDGHSCTVCGASDHLEAAHFDHNRRSPNYNKITNGRILCPVHHLQDHIFRAGTNGLTDYQNEWAIHSIEQRIAQQGLCSSRS